MADTSLLLSLKDVTKAFGTRLLFKHVNLEFRRGTLSLLIGKNGAGKSTLMRVMAGLCKPNSGTVNQIAEQSKVGYMAHAPFIYQGLSARANLLFWAKAYGLKNASGRVDEVLENVGLSRHAEEDAGIFSRGMSQRLNLARLMLPEPELILLDEPSTGLDTESKAMLAQWAVGEKNKGAAIIWISHSLEEDSHYATRILTLEKRTVTSRELGVC